MRETDGTRREEGGKNRSAAYVEIVKSTCSFGQSGRKGNCTKRRKRGNQFSPFLCRLALRRGGLLFSTPDSYTHKCVHTHLSQLQRTDVRIEIAVSQFKEPLESVTRNDYCVCSRCGMTKRGFRNVAFCFRIRWGFSMRGMYTSSCTELSDGRSNFCTNNPTNGCVRVKTKITRAGDRQVKQ